MMLHVIAVLTAQPGKRAALLSAFLDNVPAVRAEAGCIEYAATVDAEGFADLAPVGADTFVVVEKWESAEALRAHARAPHMRSYGERTRDLLAASAIHVLSPA